jgi:hypothetical protein
MIPQDCTGFGFGSQAHPAAYIEIRVGGCNAGDGPKYRQMWNYFLLGPFVQGTLK